MPHCNTRSMELCCHLHQRVQNKPCLYRKTGGSPDSSHVESEKQLVQKAQVLIQDTLFGQDL
jgi:hypothetical protein